MKKEAYIDLMDRVLSAYSDEHIKKYIDSVKKDKLQEHGFPRLTANIGVLIAHGKRLEYKDDFVTMMNLCCDQIPHAKSWSGDVGNDFSVKEIVFCLLELEKAGVFEKNITDNWRNNLASINIQDTYSVIAPTPLAPVGNWAAFGAASEQARKYAKIADESDFIEHQILSQLFSFDENGMYMDPHEPMVYDFVTRLQLGTALFFGFDGLGKRELEEFLLKSADITLKMQSTTGEIPYGGRSSQFLHNEATFAALCEFYATTLSRRGDLETAGKFKRAIELAIENVKMWLSENEIHHVKNFYDKDSMFGCEKYAYFDKYMITAASSFYLSYLLADDSIPPCPCPVESENYICHTSPKFHKTMCKFGDYFAEFDTKADMSYDASGLGRLHKKGAPSALCLSLPFAKAPNYAIDIENPSPFSICAGIKTDDGFVYTYDNNSTYKLIVEEVTDDYASVQFECSVGDNLVINQKYTLSESGLFIEATADGDIEILFPVFDFDGETYTDITVSDKNVVVRYKGHRCFFESVGTITDKNSVFANRNGHYKGFAASGTNNITLKIRIEKTAE